MKSVDTILVIDPQAKDEEALMAVDSFVGGILVGAMPMLPLDEAKTAIDLIYDHALSCPNCFENRFNSNKDEVELHRSLTHKLLDCLINLRAIIAEGKQIGNESVQSNHPGTETQQ
jgi:hypothetical protein